MTRRPKEHEVGAKALKAVSRLISSAGHKPKEIVNDYGEDLLVQTHHEGQMDASRLWVQVKGTAAIERHRLQGDGLRLSISFDHAMRWIGTLDLVVVVLWDVVERVGWYAIPSDQVDAFEGLNAGKKTVTLHFAEDDILTKEAVDRLVWRSRLEHYRLLVLGARNAELDLERTEGVKSAERVLTALDFADLIRITERRSEPDGLRYRVRAEVQDEFLGIFNTLPKGRDKAEEQRNVIKAAYATVYLRGKMIEPEFDLPSALIEESAEFLLKALEERAGVRGIMEEAEAREAEEAQEAGWPGEALR